MNSNTLRPSQRFFIAVFGYLLIGFAPQGEQLGSWALPVVAVLCAIYVAVALRAAAPGLLQPVGGKRKMHPVQTGKAHLNKRQRLAMMDRV